MKLYLCLADSGLVEAITQIKFDDGKEVNMQWKLLMNDADSLNGDITKEAIRIVNTHDLEWIMNALVAQECSEDELHIVEIFNEVTPSENGLLSEADRNWLDGVYSQELKKEELA